MAQIYNVFGNFSNKIADRLKTNAKREITAYETAKEYDLLILAFIVLKFIIMLISIYSGFKFFELNLNFLIESEVLRTFASVAILATIEVINAYLLFKFFKFLLKKKVKVCAALFLMIVAFYSISFQISCEGIRLLKSNTAEVESELKKQAENDIKNAEIQSNTEIEIINNTLQSINGYKGKFTIAQQNKIDSLNKAKILILQSKQQRVKEIKTELQNNIENATAEAAETGEKYYNYVAIIMLFQIVANFLIVYFYTRIYNENCKDELLEENLREISENFEESAQNIYYAINQQVINRNYNAMRNIMNEKNIKSYIITEDNNEHSEHEHNAPSAAMAAAAREELPTAQSAGPGTAAEPETKKIKINGFRQQADTETESETEKNKISEKGTAAVSEEKNKISEQENNKRVCKNCGEELPSSMYKTAKYCCDKCRIEHYNKTHTKKLKYSAK